MTTTQLRPTTDPVRVWTELQSARALTQLMDSRGLSGYDLATLASRELYRANKKRKGRRTSIGKSTIYSLCNGTTKNTSPEVATAIAEVLNIPRDVLFTDHMSNYTVATGRKKTTA